MFNASRRLLGISITIGRLFVAFQLRHTAIGGSVQFWHEWPAFGLFLGPLAIDWDPR